jgi:hypothetical protein
MKHQHPLKNTDLVLNPKIYFKILGDSPFKSENCLTQRDLHETVSRDGDGLKAELLDR